MIRIRGTSYQPTMIKLRITKAAAACILAAFTADAPLAAAPEWHKELNSPRAGNHPALPPTALEYALSWRGMINAGQLRMEIDPRDANKPGRLVIKSSARSTGAAARLYPYSHHFWAEMHPRTLKPTFFQGQESDRREDTATRVRYFTNRVESHERAVAKRGGKVTTEDKTFEHRDVHNIFSAMLHIRSQDLRKGRKHTIVVQPFDNPYLLTVESHGAEQHDGRSAIRCTLTMRKIDRDTLELSEYKKLRRPATLWLSNDADRVILELRAAVFIGDVRATLVNKERL